MQGLQPHVSPAVPPWGEFVVTGSVVLFVTQGTNSEYYKDLAKLFSCQCMSVIRLVLKARNMPSVDNQTDCTDQSIANLPDQTHLSHPCFRLQAKKNPCDVCNSSCISSLLQPGTVIMEHPNPCYKISITRGFRWRKGRPFAYLLGNQEWAAGLDVLKRSFDLSPSYKLSHTFIVCTRFKSPGETSFCK